MEPWSPTSVQRSCSCTTASTTPHTSTTWTSRRRSTTRHSPRVTAYLYSWSNHCHFPHTQSTAVYWPLHSVIYCDSSHFFASTACIWFCVAGDVTTQVALQPALKFNGGGHINHTIFWTNLSPNGGGEPQGKSGGKMWGEKKVSLRF